MDQNGLPTHNAFWAILRKFVLTATAHQLFPHSISFQGLYPFSKRAHFSYPALGRITRIFMRLLTFGAISSVFWPSVLRSEIKYLGCCDIRREWCTDNAKHFRLITYNAFFERGSCNSGSSSHNNIMDEYKSWTGRRKLEFACAFTQVTSHHIWLTLFKTTNFVLDM